MINAYTVNTSFSVRKRIPSKFKTFLPIMSIIKSGIAEKESAVKVIRLAGITADFLLLGIKAFPSTSIKKARIKRAITSGKCEREAALAETVAKRSSNRADKNITGLNANRDKAVLCSFFAKSLIA